MSFLKEVYSGIIKKIFSEDAVKEIGEILNAIDPWKWGSPLTEGEGHYINDILVDKFYNSGGPNKDKSVVNLIELYEDELRDDFAYFRRGWVAEYIGDGFAENEFNRILFLAGVRIPGGEAIVESLETVEMNPGSPSKTSQKIFWAPLWASFFFYLSTGLVGFVQGMFMDPLSVLDPAIFPVLLLWWLSYVKWYGKYGMYIPGIGTQSFWSAMATVGLFALSVRVVLDVTPFLSMDNVPLFFGWNGGANFVFGDDPTNIRLSAPNPLLLGTGHLIKGLAWPTVLLLWGLSGIGNIFYGEWAEHHSAVEEFKKKIIDQYEAKTGKWEAN